MLAAHCQLATEFGNQADRVVAEARARSQGQAAEQSPETMRRAAQAAATFARDRSFELEAVTDERGLFRDALRRAMSEATYAEVRANFAARVASGEFQALPG